MEPTPNLTRIGMWVDALVSGDYKQGVGALGAWGPFGIKKYCCLGVACEVAMLNGLKLRRVMRQGGITVYGDEDSVLPQEVQDWYGLESSNPALLGAPEVSWDSYDEAIECSSLNDERGYTFEEIAELIRDQYLSLVP